MFLQLRRIAEALQPRDFKIRALTYKNYHKNKMEKLNFTGNTAAQMFLNLK